MNECIFSGRLTAVPQLKQTPSGISVCSFTLAVDRSRKKDQENETDFLSMVVWRQKAEFIARWFDKGSKINVITSARTRKYDKDGQTHYITEFVVNEAEFADSRKSGGEESVKPQNQNELSEYEDLNINSDNLPF